MDIIIREMKQSDWRPVSNIYQEGIKTKTATFEQDALEYEEWNQSHFPTCRLVAANDSIDRDGRTPKPRWDGGITALAHLVHLVIYF